MSSELPTFAKPDFPDWLSPMLVKELRQGLRSRTFLVLFVAIQIAMVFPAVFGLLDAVTGESNEGPTVFFWLLVTVPLVIAMPASGLSAINAETQGNTLEPIFLTRLTARRIILGKWVAIVVQTLLLVSAFLPFVVLRYYMGNVNLVSELEILGAMVAGSAILTAVAVGLSPMVGKVGRILIPVVTVCVLFFGSQSLFGMRGSFGVVRGGGGGLDWATNVASALVAALLAAVMLETGAGKIAPAAENHSTAKRSLALAAIGVALLFTNLPGDREWIWFPAIFIVVVTSIGAICEPISPTASTYRPFLRWGFWGRVLGRLLYPGWPAGFLFVLLGGGFALYHLHVWATRSASAGADPPELTLLHIGEIAMVGALLLPMALYRLAGLKKTPALGFYFGVQGLFGVLSVIGCLHFGAWDRPTVFESVVACLPACALCYAGLMSSWTPIEQTAILAGNALVTLAVLLVLAVKSWPAWRAIAKLEKNAGQVPVAAASPDVAQPVVAD